MPKYLVATAVFLLFSTCVFAQSLTVAGLIKLSEAKPDTTTAYLQSKQFHVDSKSEFGVKSTIYRKKTGTIGETIAKSKADSARKIPSGITYMYDKPAFTEVLVGELKGLSFKLKYKTDNDGKGALWVYVNDKYEARVSTYNDTSMSSSIAISRADKRLLTD